MNHNIYKVAYKSCYLQGVISAACRELDNSTTRYMKNCQSPGYSCHLINISLWNGRKSRTMTQRLWKKTYMTKFHDFCRIFKVSVLSSEVSPNRDCKFLDHIFTESFHYYFFKYLSEKKHTVSRDRESRSKMSFAIYNLKSKSNISFKSLELHQRCKM